MRGLLKKKPAERTGLQGQMLGGSGLGGAEASWSGPQRLLRRAEELAGALRVAFLGKGRGAE